MPKAILALMLTGVGFAATVPAANAEQVLNGGFETGDFSDWTLSSSATPSNTTVTGDPTYVHGGAYGAKLGPSGSDGFLSQMLTTTPGQAYDISFYLESINNPTNGSTPNDFSMTFGSATLLPSATIAPQSYTLYKYSGVVATSDTTNLAFGFRDDPSYLGLDDVSVTASDPSAAPEPSSRAGLALIGLGLTGLMLRARKTSTPTAA